MEAEIYVGQVAEEGMGLGFNCAIKPKLEFGHPALGDSVEDEC